MKFTWPYMEWKIYVDKQLPFNSRSAPFLFNRLADSLHWILVNECGVVNIIYYLDGFFIAAPSAEECGKLLQTVCDLCEITGVPLAPEKVVGPESIMPFLGIKFDVPRQEIRLPRHKLEELRVAIRDWLK